MAKEGKIPAGMTMYNIRLKEGSWGPGKARAQNQPQVEKKAAATGNARKNERTKKIKLQKDNHPSKRRKTFKETQASSARLQFISCEK